MDKITVAVPCYNEEAALSPFFAVLTDVAEKMNYVDFEFLFINDGSRDKTLEKIKELAEADKRVKYISFSRNFGKEAGIYAGLKNASGDYVVIMDADLQDPPALLPEMYQAVTDEGYDCVGSRRVTRKGEPPIRSFFARMFYKLINKMSDADIVDGARDFQMMSRKVVDAILAMGEYNRFSKGIFGWIGFRKKWLEYENIERVAGETKWSFWKLFLYALEGIVALFPGVHYDPGDHCQNTGIRRSYCRLAVYGVHYVAAQRYSDAGYRYRWPVPGKNLPGNQKASHLPGGRNQPGTGKISREYQRTAVVGCNI